MKFVFFGSSPISITSLNLLKEKKLIPTLIVTKPDSPQGRGLELTPTPVKVWAIENKIEVITPDSLKENGVIDKIKSIEAEVGVLVSYGKIVPETLINLFPKGIVNLHPSLLPRLRGPAPIEFTILEDKKEGVGVSIMILDKGTDTGPIIAQKEIETSEWPIGAKDLYNLLSEKGAELLAETIEPYVSGKIIPIAQDDSKATYSRMIEKSDGEILPTDDPYKNFLKFKAFEGWPGTFMFLENKGKKIRVKITDAIFEDGEFRILKVIPEGKKETDFEIFKNNFNSQ